MMLIKELMALIVLEQLCGADVFTHLLDLDIWIVRLVLLIGPRSVVNDSIHA